VCSDAQSLQRAGRNLDGAVDPQPERLLQGHVDRRIGWDLEAEVHPNGEGAMILSELNDTRFAQTVPQSGCATQTECKTTQGQ
jgi:hypothetical protein